MRPRDGQLHRRLGRLSDTSREGGRSHPAVGDDLREVGRLRQFGAPDPGLAPAGAASRRGAQRCVAGDGVRQALPALGGLGRQRCRVLPQGSRTDTCPMSWRRPRSWATPRTHAVRRPLRDLGEQGFSWPDPVARGSDNCTVEAAGIEWFPEKALFEEYAQFGRGHAHDLADFDLYYEEEVRGLRWPVIDGKETPGASTRSTTRM